MSKTIATVALAAVGIGAVYYMYKQMQVGTAPATARGVTASTKGNLTTSVVQSGRVAAVGIPDPLAWISSAVNRAATLIPGNLSNGSAATNYRIPFGNPESAAAASNATKFTNVSNYRPSSWAGVSIMGRSGV